MNFSERNKKVAINRWKKTIEKERENMKKDYKSMLFRASLCGFLAGDGSVQVRREKTYFCYQLDFFPDDEDMLNEYLKQMKYVYNRRPFVKKEKNFFTVRITSKSIVTDLLEYAQFGLQKWDTPKKLLEYKDAKKCWLKAFFSAEGTVNNERIKIQSINGPGITKVSELLTELSIPHKIYHYMPKKKNYNEVHIIMIFRKEARKMYFKEIGFWHSKKERILKESLDL